LVAVHGVDFSGGAIDLDAGLDNRCAVPGMFPPMRRDTICRMASVIKTVRAGAAMILVEEYQLRLGRPARMDLASAREASSTHLPQPSIRTPGGTS
jgi:hypothetical protein